jgi:hypothetical protein
VFIHLYNECVLSGEYLSNDRREEFLFYCRTRVLRVTEIRDEEDIISNLKRMRGLRDSIWVWR